MTSAVTCLLCFIAGSVVTLLILLIYIYDHRTEYEERYSKMRFARMSLSDYVPVAGDILFMNFPCRMPIINFALGSFFHHVGIVVNNDGVMCNLEIARRYALFP